MFSVKLHTIAAPGFGYGALIMASWTETDAKGYASGRFEPSQKEEWQARTLK